MELRLPSRIQIPLMEDLSSYVDSQLYLVVTCLIISQIYQKLHQILISSVVVFMPIIQSNLLSQSAPIMHLHQSYSLILQVILKFQQDFKPIFQLLFLQLELCDLNEQDLGCILNIYYHSDNQNNNTKLFLYVKNIEVPLVILFTLAALAHMAMIYVKQRGLLGLLEKTSSQLFTDREVFAQSKFHIEDIVSVKLRIIKLHSPSKDYDCIIGVAYLMVIWSILHKNHFAIYPSVKDQIQNYKSLNQQSWYNQFIEYSQTLANKTKLQILMILSSNHFNQLISSTYKNKQFQVVRQQLPIDSSLILVHFVPLFEIDKKLPYRNNGLSFIYTQEGNAELVKKGTANITTLKMDSFDYYYKQRNPKDPIQLQIECLIKKINSAKPIQLFKAEYPHGYEIEVKYSQANCCWIISFNNQSIIFRTKEHVTERYPHKNHLLKQLALFWINRYDDKQEIKKLLQQYTLKGIVNYSLTQAKWYELQRLILQQDIYAQNPITSQVKLQALGLSFIAITQLNTPLNQDQLHRIVQENSRKIFISPYQNKINQYGRCRILFVSSVSGKVQHCFNLLTFEDVLFTAIQQMLLSEVDISIQQIKLKQLYNNLKNDWNVSTAYPWCYYQNLLMKVGLIVEVGSCTSQFIKQNWQFLLKLALYMSTKRISIEKYGLQYINSINIKKQLSLISFYNFGPVGCRRINFFSFISVGNGVRQLINLFKQRFQLVDQHFKELTGINISQYSFIQTLNETKNYQISNYFLQICPQKYQWQRFMHNFSKSKIDETVCQLITIGESSKDYYNIDEKTYPLSVQTLSNAYLQAYSLRKTQRLLKDKIVELSKITSKCKLLQQRYHNQQNVVQISFHSNKQIKEIEQGIKIILKSESDEDKIYYLLLARIQKYKLAYQSRWNLTQQHISFILSKLYFNIPAIIPESIL